MPGAQASEIALCPGPHRNQLYAWRREFGAITAANAGTTEPGSVPVVALSDADAAIEIEIGSAIVPCQDWLELGVLGRVLRLLKAIR